MDVIEEIGFDVSHRCYWDFGRWSDLCRVWRPAGDDLQFDQAVDFEVSSDELLAHALPCFAMLFVVCPALPCCLRYSCFAMLCNALPCGKEINLLSHAC